MIPEPQSVLYIAVTHGAFVRAFSKSIPIINRKNGLKPLEQIGYCGIAAIKFD